jgi:hypothetical protein
MSGRKRQAGSGAVVIILILIAVPVGVLLVAGTAALAWHFWPRENPAPVARTPAALPRVPRIGEAPPGPIGGQPAPGARGGDGSAVGMKAPEIEGEDIDGKKFKLSDYRGKVVLLDFWGNW